jgi:hypothetical protein
MEKARPCAGRAPYAINTLAPALRRDLASQLDLAHGQAPAQGLFLATTQPLYHGQREKAKGQAIGQMADRGL